LLQSEEPIAVIDLKVRTEQALDVLHDRGAHSHIPRADLDYAIEVGLRMLSLRRIVEEGPEGLVVRDRGILGYYANAIAHL